MPKSSLPEYNIDDVRQPDMVIQARNLSEVRSRIAQLQTQEKTLKSLLAESSEAVRREEADKDNFVGLLRITANGLPPIRTEFRIKGGPLNVSEESRLDELYGASRHTLFSREKVITEILDPEQLIQDLKDSGKNPWDYLQIGVKESNARSVAESSTAVTSDEAFLPKKGFLATLNSIVNTLRSEAKEFTKKYLETSLAPTVVVGTKGKA